MPNDATQNLASDTVPTTEADAADGSVQTDEKQSPIPTAVRAAIPLGVAAVVVVFVALGVEGDVLSRLIRMNPIQVAVAFALALVGVSLPIILAAAPRNTQSWAAGVGGALVLTGSLVGLFSGTSSIADREQPDIQISTVQVPATEAGGEPDIEIDITATGISLAPNEHMLLRVVALGPSLSPAGTTDLCRNGDWPGELPDNAERKINPGEEDATFRVLYWGESGPNRRGEVTADAKVRVSPAYTHACGYAVLQRTSDNEAKWRATLFIVDLRNAPTPSEPSEQPSPSPSPSPSP